MAAERCENCRRFPEVLEVRPLSVPIVRCATCGAAHLDPVTLLARRQATPRRAARMFFGMGAPWRTCFICDAALFPPEQGGAVHCTRCGESYESLPSRPVKAPASLEEVFELTLQRPDDDEPRRLLADLLLEQGDSRGEFIHLQLDAARGPQDVVHQQRMRELLERDAWRWVPPGVAVEHARFERGLLTRANFPSITDPQHPGWRSVTHVEVGPRQAPPAQRAHSPLGGPLFHSVRHLSRCGLHFIDWLRHAPPPWLRTLGVQVSATTWRPVLPGVLMLAVAGLPALDELDLAGVSIERYPWGEWATAFVASLNGKVKTLWLPMPFEPAVLRGSELAKRAPELVLKFATAERDGARTVVTLSKGGVEVSLAPDETLSESQRAQMLAAALQQP